VSRYFCLPLTYLAVFILGQGKEFRRALFCTIITKKGNREIGQNGIAALFLSFSAVFLAYQALSGLAALDHV